MQREEMQRALLGSAKDAMRTLERACRGAGVTLVQVKASLDILHAVGLLGPAAEPVQQYEDVKFIEIENRSPNVTPIRGAEDGANEE